MKNKFRSENRPAHSVFETRSQILRLVLEASCIAGIECKNMKFAAGYGFDNKGLLPQLPHCAKRFCAQSILKVVIKN